MKKMLISVAALSGIGIAAPVAAQYPIANQNGSSVEAGANLSARIAHLQTRMQTGVQSGAITRQEARPLRQQLRQLTQLERRYSRDGLTRQERTDLQQRIRPLRQDLRMADGRAHGRDDQPEQWDRDDGYAQNGRYGRENGEYSDRIDSNRDGYDDRDYNRNGRWDDDMADGRDQPAQRGGLGGIFDRILGNAGGSGLRVGEQASANLYGVPTEYRNQYRDGNGVYYRSDGRQIYQIDARTQTVARIYSMNN